MAHPTPVESEPQAQQVQQVQPDPVAFKEQLVQLEHRVLLEQLDLQAL
jgi:hypothetical protein